MRALPISVFVVSALLHVSCGGDDDHLGQTESGLTMAAQLVLDWSAPSCTVSGNQTICVPTNPESVFAPAEIRTGHDVYDDCNTIEVQAELALPGDITASFLLTEHDFYSCSYDVDAPVKIEYHEQAADGSELFRAVVVSGQIEHRPRSCSSCGDIRFDLQALGAEAGGVEEGEIPARQLRRGLIGSNSAGSCLMRKLLQPHVELELNLLACDPPPTSSPQPSGSTTFYPWEEDYEYDYFDDYDYYDYYDDYEDDDSGYGGYSGGGYDDSGGCDDGYESDSGGCEGDSSGGGCEGDSGGCESDSSGGCESDSSSGCESDSSGGCEGGDSGGCEGDSGGDVGCEGSGGGCEGDSSWAASGSVPAACRAIPRCPRKRGGGNDTLAVICCLLFVANRSWRFRRR